MADPLVPTHAGGLVYRDGPAGIEFLLVTGRRKPDEWVLPKGHIERGETPEQTAIREVEEEAGVRAAITVWLRDLERTIGSDRQCIRVFLMRVKKDGPPGEGRQSCWLPGPAALERLTFADAKDLVQRALTSIGERAAR